MFVKSVVAFVEIDRARNGGMGREMHTLRLTGVLSAIGTFSLNIGGEALPKHLKSVKVVHIRKVSLFAANVGSSVLCGICRL